MRGLLLAALAAVSMIVAGPGLAQAPAPPDKTPPRAAPAPDAKPPAAAPRRAVRSGKRLECQREARKKGLRGRAATDAANICYQEARLDCLRQAVSAGVAQRDRSDYIAKCLGEEPRPRRKTGDPQPPRRP